MQVTLDIPDELYAEASVVAKQESRSLTSVLLDLIRGGHRNASRPTKNPKVVTDWKLPEIECSRDFTIEEIDLMLEEDRLL